MYLSFYCNVCVWEGVGDRTKTAIYWPHSYGHQCCVFLVLLMLNQRPRGSAFCWVLAFSTTSCYQQVSETTGGPEGPFGWEWLSLPHLISHFSGPQLTDFLSSQSYIIVQRPLNRPLNLWNGMFDRHQAEITIMQFTGHSLPVHQSMSVPWEFLPCPILSAKPAYMISSQNCNWNVSLPSGASLWNGKFGRVEGQTLVLAWLKVFFADLASCKHYSLQLQSSIALLHSLLD